MEKLRDSIIGEYFDDGFVEALINRPNGGPSLRVCVRVHQREKSVAAIIQAEALLPTLIVDMAAAEALATKAAGSSVPSTTFDIWIEPDGDASFTCGFFDGEAEDTLVTVQRSKDGQMILS